jgi:hypothetical protein
LITAAVVAAVILLNVAVTLIGDFKLWYIDLTRERYISGESAMYTLSESCIELVGDQAVSMVESINAERKLAGEDAIKINIIFCADRDVIEANGYMRYVSYTARCLANEFSDSIAVKYIDIQDNPSAVQKYKTTSAATIYSSDVIVEFGSEYLVQGSDSFFYTDTGKDEPWAYNGEQKLAAMMLSVTRADSPVCAITVNHGEGIVDADGKVAEKYTTFVKLVEGAGYEVRLLDLEKENIPENCRMMITLNPQTDFKAFGNLGEGGVSEIEKLDKYLDGANAFFYICDQSSPELKNLEEYLSEWGVTVNRVEDKAGYLQNCVISDREMCVDAGRGNVILGNYATEGLGATLTKDMRAASYPPKVVFGDATSIVPAENYNKSYAVADEESGALPYVYYSYYKNGISRTMVDVFTTHTSAEALVDGKVYEIATEGSMFKLMTVTQEGRQVQQSNLTTVNQASYVLALSSTEFVENDCLDSTSYGNTDVILSALRNTGSAVVPANIDLKAFYQYDVSDEFAYKSQNPSAWVKVLAITPAALAVCVGVFVTVRRKYR